MDYHQKCVEFCSAIGLSINNDDDKSLAQFYLEEAGLNVDVAIQNYGRQQAVAQKLEDPVQVASDTLVTNPELAASSSTHTAHARPDSPQCTPAEMKASGVAPTTTLPSTSTRHKIRLITWNIDGLDEKNTKERTMAMCDILTSHAPDIVYLQEVIFATYSLIESRMPDYTIICASKEGYQYFTAIMLRKVSVQMISEEVVPFPGTVMLRALQTIQVKCAGIDLTLMCSHLESTKQHTKERKNQLKLALDHMQKAPATSTVIFGGDTNLRDTEVTKIGGLPNGICDIWQLCGEPKDAKFTWDLTENHNLDWPYPNRPKCRFDRLFLRHCSPNAKVSAESFALTGKKQLATCKRFPSDHWGIVCDFKVLGTHA